MQHLRKQLAGPINGPALHRMKVQFQHKNGRQMMLPKRTAEILQCANLGTYRTRDLVSERSLLTVEELRELATRMGVKIHHRAGAKKILAALQEAGL